jgi:hypothetical protein
MAESWESRKKRLERIREGFPQSLRGIPIRYVEDVAALSVEGLQALELAYQKEPVNIPRALGYLRSNLFISLEELQKRAKPMKAGRKSLEEANSSSDDSKTLLLSKVAPSKKDQERLGQLLSACYPGMPAVTAESMAASEVMKEALAVVTTTREAIESSHAQSDFVILSLLKLFIESKKQVQEIIRNTPALQKAFEQSNIAVDQ